MCNNRAITLALATLALCGTARTARPSSIVQAINFQFALHGSNFQVYNQFNPALGTLDEVDLAISGVATSDTFTFQNVSRSPVTFTGFTQLQFEAAAPATTVTIRSTFTETLSSLEIDPGRSASGPFTAAAAFNMATSNLARWIGTGMLPPDLFFTMPPISQAGASDPNIFVQGNPQGFIDGTETVTYLYNITPEPASIVMLGLGLAAVAAMAWYRRAA